MGLLAASIDFFTSKLGFTLEFRYSDFYAGVRHGKYAVHVKSIDEPDPSIAFVERGDHFHLYFETDDVAREADASRALGVPFVQNVHDTDWGTRECVIKDNEGHTLSFGHRLP